MQYTVENFEKPSKTSENTLKVDKECGITQDKSKFSVFISHSSKDSSFVHFITSQLQHHGFTPIVAKNERPKTFPQYLPDKIKTLIQQSDCVVALITKNGVNSEWVHQEIGYTLDKKPLIPIVESDIPSEKLCFLQGVEYISLYKEDIGRSVNSLIPWITNLKTKEEENENKFKEYLSSIIRNTPNNIINDYYIELLGDVMEISWKGVATSPIKIYNYVDEWLVKENKNLIIILGEYGCGKTTFCQKYAYDLADKYIKNYERNDFRIPIVIKLSGYEKLLNIQELLIKELQKTKCEIKDFETIRKLNKEGKLIFILDGLDEALPQGGRDPATKLFNSIAEFTHEEKSKIILTCRTEFFRTRQEIIDLLRYPDGRESIIVLDLKELNPSQIKKYLQKKFPEKWDYYWSKIRQVPSMNDLARRPVFLNIITNHLPTLLETKQEVDISFLYECCINDELNRKVLDRETKITIESEERQSLMKQLAIYMYLNNENEIYYMTILTEINFKNLFGPLYEEKLRTYIHDFLSCSFLTRDNDGFYRFSHSSFKDFFVSQVLLDEIKTNKPDVFKKIIIGYTIMDFMKKKQIQNILFQWIQKKEVEEGFLGSNVLSLLNSIDSNFTNHGFIKFNDRDDLRCVDLNKANLIGATFEKSNLERANFHSANLRDANFINTNLQSADLCFAALANTNFTGADLTEARFEELGTINEVAWNANGRYICCTDTKGRIIIFEKIENKGDLYFRYFKLFENYKSSVNTISWFLDNKNIVSGSSDETVRIWDIETDVHPMYQFPSFSGNVKTVRVIQDKYILAAFQNGDIRLFDIKHGECLSSEMDCFYKFNRIATAYAVNSMGNILFAGYEDGTISILNFDIKNISFNIFKPTMKNMHAVVCMSLAPNEKQLYVGYANKKIRIWDLDRQRSDIISELKTIEGHEGSITTLSISPDSNILASGDSWGRVILWNISDPLRCKKIVELIIKDENKSITSLYFSSNGNFLAGSNSNGILNIWELRDRIESKGYIHYIIPDCKDMVFENAKGICEGLKKTFRSCGAKKGI